MPIQHRLGPRFEVVRGGYAGAGMALDKALLPEVILTMGCIPLAEYSTPTTDEVARAIGLCDVVQQATNRE